MNSYSSMINHQYGIFTIWNDYLILPIVKTGIVSIINCSILSLDSCHSLDFTPNTNTSNYVIISLGDPLDFLYDLSPVDPVTFDPIAPISNNNGPLPNNTKIEIIYLGSVYTDPDTVDITVYYLIDDYFEIECSCGSAFYVDLNYTLITDSTYLSL